MTIPVHFAIKEAKVYKKLKSMFKQIDNLQDQDSFVGQEVKDSLLKAATKVIQMYDKEVTELVMILQQQFAKQGIYQVILRPSPTAPFLSDLQLKDQTKYPGFASVNISNIL